jgi:glyoxylase-like metal-dependent hydrolase (beta-lactamase superfamily II)
MGRIPSSRRDDGNAAGNVHDSAGRTTMSDEDVHEIYAVRYGHHDRRSQENFVGGDPHDILQPLDYFVWAIVGPAGVIVVDTGFDAGMAGKRGRTLLRPAGEGLRAIGIAPEAVENVIVSHLHYDHTGNYDLFPRARYHLQDTEMAYATGRCMCHAYLKMPFEEEDVVAMVRKVFAGRVAFHDGAAEVAPGVTVHKIGGHSKGLQSIRVKTRRGFVVLASDATHLYAHLEGGRVFPTTYHIGEVLEGYATLGRLATSPAHIVPGHDPAVLDRYPPAKPGLEGWVVRLDADPKR